MRDLPPRAHLPSTLKTSFKETLSKRALCVAIRKEDLIRSCQSRHRLALDPTPVGLHIYAVSVELEWETTSLLSVFRDSVERPFRKCKSQLVAKNETRVSLPPKFFEPRAPPKPKISEGRLFFPLAEKRNMESLSHLKGL